MTPLRLLVLTDHYPPHSLGGYEVACHAVSEGLRERGHDVLVMTSNHVAASAPSPTHVRRVLHRPQDSPSLFRLAGREMADHRALSRAVAEWKPQVVSAWSLLNLFPSLHVALASLPVPVVYNLHDLWLPGHVQASERRWQAWGARGSSVPKRAVKAAARGALRVAAPFVLRPVTLDDVRVRHAVFCSRFRHEQHVVAGLAPADSRVIYNGVDLARFTGTPRRPAGAPRLLFVGRLVKEKGLDTVIEAIARLDRQVSGITLTVAGVPSYPHDYTDSLRQAVRERGLNARVRFVDPVPNEQMPALYAEHDVLVFPSIGPEGFPVTLLEAAACGLAIVGSLTGGTGEFLEDRMTGLTFPAGDARALATCLEELQASPALVEQLASAAQARVRERFDIHRIVDQTAAYLERLIA
jgi:glycosyltransferase involved in cell wall biosynthesis